MGVISQFVELLNKDFLKNSSEVSCSVVEMPIFGKL